ncbi:subclass B1 metallo-beta-lactamase [Vitiosangium sp. GDMCC 1.1324]|uniref:subclass B1 metallo-beta-lactamase n=1 Tax=Vitiosangium sp. (strain GDMCC 1.1324) TaxID=2138576 RepID=UPI000D36683F|nr:subclass B1 metallo-beta-lactamase [Vitiosangium sp. GDMCC 1.1324]PTL77194.1 subclass B1 metallo-beta-lactamase [Vitiosangium sp. GDMCC 1.1324]
MPTFRSCILLVLLTACASSRPTPSTETRPAAPSEETVLADDVRVQRLAPGIWLHVTLAGEDWGRTPANGLLIEDGESSLLVDTGWNAKQAEHLLAWARDTLHRPVRAAVVTHFHIDRTGGVPALEARGVPVYARAETAKLASEHGQPVPAQRIADTKDLGPLSFFFPGAGHARDNLVVWHRASGLLFGGCFVKDADAHNLGNVADADVPAWPQSLERVRQRYPDVRTVVPGHGLPGGLELLTRTQELLREAGTGGPAPH